jgi:hypothetical protein
VCRGYITRHQLLVLLDLQMYQMEGQARPGTIEYEYYLSLMNYKYDLKNIQLPPESNQHDFVLDVIPYMDR